MKGEEVQSSPSRCGSRLAELPNFVSKERIDFGTFFGRQRIPHLQKLSADPRIQSDSGCRRPAHNQHSFAVVAREFQQQFQSGGLLPLEPQLLDSQPFRLQLIVRLGQPFLERRQFGLSRGRAFLNHVAQDVAQRVEISWPQLGRDRIGLHTLQHVPGVIRFVFELQDRGFRQQRERVGRIAFFALSNLFGDRFALLEASESRRMSRDDRTAIQRQISQPSSRCRPLSSRPRPVFERQCPNLSAAQRHMPAVTGNRTQSARHAVRSRSDRHIPSGIAVRQRQRSDARLTHQQHLAIRDTVQRQPVLFRLQPTPRAIVQSEAHDVRVASLLLVEQFLRRVDDRIADDHRSR